jgi:predicted dehydrogenase
MKYGVGIIGAGFGQHVHVPVFQDQPDCEVVGIAASTPAKAKTVAERCDVARAYNDWQELVADDAVDIVCIAVPPGQQPQMIYSAVERGKHVFCEKPLGVDGGSTALLQDINGASPVICIDFEFPETPLWRALKTVVGSGDLGAIRHVDLHWHVETYAHRNKLDNWKTRPADGGGALGGLLPHSLHYLEWLFGPVTDVMAALGDNEARVAAHLRFCGGFEAAVSAAVDDPNGDGHRLEVFGADSTAVLHNPGKDYVNGFSLKVDNAAVDVAGVPPDVDGRRYAVGALASRFVESIRQGVPMNPGLAEGLRVQRLMDVMRASDGAWTVVAA